MSDIADNAIDLARSVADRYASTTTSALPPTPGAAAPSKSASADKRIDPFLASRFYVEIDSDAKALFTECSGLSVETEVMEYAEGGVNDHVHKLPGRTKYSNVTLRRGWAQTDELWKWYEKTIAGKLERRDVSVLMFENKGQNAGQEVARWNLKDAYPVKWQGPEFRADSNATAIETLELAHAGWVRAK